MGKVQLVRREADRGREHPRSVGGGQGDLALVETDRVGSRLVSEPPLPQLHPLAVPYLDQLTPERAQRGALDAHIDGEATALHRSRNTPDRHTGSVRQDLTGKGEAALLVNAPPDLLLREPDSPFRRSGPRWCLHGEVRDDALLNVGS